MVLIFLLAILIVITLYADKFIKKNFTVIAVTLSILSAISYIFFDITNIINEGFIGLAFLILVMFTTAFKKESKLYKKNLLLRKEYSILGFITIIPHSLLFLFGEYQSLEWNGIISFIIMIPLFITSFIIIRKKMNNETWAKLQTLAYPAYLLIFTHLIIVGQPEHKVIYSVLLLTYIIMKLKNEKFQKIKKYNLGLISGIVIFFVLVFNLNNLNMTINHISIEDNIYEDGTYYGEATGYKNYSVEVNVELEDNVIKDIEIIDCGCTGPAKGINFESAVNQVRDEIIEKQTLDVDTVSGATKSTSGVINAVSNAVEEAIILE